MNEREFQGWILDVAARFGWRVWHVPAPMRPVGGSRFVPEKRAAGLPDLILLHADPPRLIFAEVKDADGRVSDEQAEFLRLARGVHDGLDRHFDAVLEAFARYIPEAREALEWINPIGVYVWRPGAESMIEAILRGKVMVAG